MSVCAGYRGYAPESFSSEMPFYSKFGSRPCGEVKVTDHLRLPLMRHPATLKTAYSGVIIIIFIIGIRENSVS